ncbi:WD40 repeat-like protein [Aspergillus aculeatinus CBS 121060]|uniref:WD40 repeat-like protein n=1 Tax=Aspergillus aculeatinus CBS 121060 TaxID=1448322 RepID=A0ACD1HBM7_9EURO|nr:WD40 repeat-like protein [Aspergillus aculeatinus CBS 121060]RAH71166.1 WD40 repeat-like protein [Aspergillus aculeatinus CBS 121060]
MTGGKHHCLTWWWRRHKGTKNHSTAEGDESSHSPAPEPLVVDSGAPIPAAGAVKSLAASATSNLVAEEKREFPTEPQQLWDESYESLKIEQSSLMKAYENILARELNAESLQASASVDQQDVIEQKDAGMRRAQMSRIIQKGLNRTEREAKIKQSVGKGVEVALAVDEIMKLALKACPEAALAWSGISLGLQILSNTAKETEANRKGLEYICSSMNWYWELSRRFLGESGIDAALYEGLRWELKAQIVGLYKALLFYQIMSVCSYYRNRLLGFLCDMVQLDDWDGSLDSVKSKEATVRERFSSYLDQYTLEYQKKWSEFLQEISKNVLAQSLQLRDMQEEKDDKKCLQHLFLTDPATDMIKIQEERESLISESCHWIVNHPQFTTWQKCETTRLLWLKGGPGKGKTMLLMSIVNHLSLTLEDNNIFSFFFCQETSKDANARVLRGLIYQILIQNRALIAHLRDVYDTQGPKLFESSNTSTALKAIFVDMIGDPKLDQVYLVVDALDECQPEDLKHLASLINESASKWPHVKWLVSSRHSVEIERSLQTKEYGQVLDLERDVEDLIHSGLSHYISHKLSDLFKRFGDTYADEGPGVIAELQDLQKKIADEVQSKASGTFLWVSLVFRQIDESDVDPYGVSEFIRQMPSTLKGMYDRMIERIINTPTKGTFESCQQTLLAATVAYRPLQLGEMKELAAFKWLTDAKRSILRCGLLSIRESDQTVSFIHQSAKDYLTDKESKFYSRLFPNGHLDGHQTIVTRSLDTMDLLHKNIDNLDSPGFHLPEDYRPHSDLLALCGYSCIYWIDHLCETESDPGKVGLCDEKIIAFCRKHFLHWLEALSLLKSLPKGVIADHPLQTYSSAILFSPERSLIRTNFKNEEPDWIMTKPAVEAEWGACLQVVEAHRDYVRAVAFSPDGERIVSGSDDKTLRIWDANNGARLNTLKGHEDWVRSVTFSPDGRHIVSDSDDSTIKIWDSISGDCLHTLKKHSGKVHSVAIAPCGKYIISGSDDQTVMMWDVSTGVYLHTLYECGDIVQSVVYSPDGRYIASTSDDEKVKIWDAAHGDLLHTFNHCGVAESVAVSYDAKLIASGTNNRVRLWDVSGTCLHTLEHYGRIRVVAFSHNSQFLASGGYVSEIKIWDVKSGACLHKIGVELGHIEALVFSPNNRHFVSLTSPDNVMIWDSNTGVCLNKLRVPFDDWTRTYAFSSDGKHIASASEDGSLKIWDASTGACLVTTRHDYAIRLVKFLSDGNHVLSMSTKGTVRLWDAKSGACVKMVKDQTPDATALVEGHKYSLDEDNMWITYNGQNLLRFPLGHEVSRWTCSSNSLVFGFRSGRIMHFKFSEKDPFAR